MLALTFHGSLKPVAYKDKHPSPTSKNKKGKQLVPAL
jgi:hypothetical protein